MSDKFRFYKIGEANAEISRLESELAKASTRVTELEGVTGNETELAVQLKERDSKIQGFESQITAHVTALAAKEKEITDLKAAQSDFEAKVEKAASAKALQITASQGAPIIPAKPCDVTVDPAKSKISELRGIDKVQAVIALEIAEKLKR